MKASEIIVRWKRKEIIARFLFIFCSIIFHFFLAYYFYTEEFPIKVVKVEKRIIQVRPVSRERIFFPGIRRTPLRERDIPDVNPPPAAPANKQAEKESAQRSGEQQGKAGVAGSGPGTPGAKPVPGKMPDIFRKQFPAQERLEAPFNPSHYLKVETVADILRRLEAEERVKFGPAGEGEASTAESGEYEDSGDIVVDRKGRAYFQGKGFDISPWARKVVAVINQNWFVMAGFDRGNAFHNKEVGITVTFSRDGNVISAEIKRPTHIQVLDQSALNAVKLSAPYPPLPEQFPDERLTAFFLFKYENE